MHTPRDWRTVAPLAGSATTSIASCGGGGGGGAFVFCRRQACMDDSVICGRPAGGGGEGKEGNVAERMNVESETRGWEKTHELKRE